MSWWKSWGGVYQGGALQNPDTGAQSAGPAGGRSDANVNVTDERAMMVSTVFRCVGLLVQSGATMPLNFYRGAHENRERLEENHYLWQLLKYRPNNFMTAKQFRQGMWACRVLWGNGYAKIKWMGDRPVSLTPLKPEYMAVYRGNTGLVYKYSTKDGTKEYQQKDIFHVRGWSTDGIMGLSALAYARQALGLSVSADRKAANSVNGNASAVLELENFPTDAQKAQLRELYGAGKVHAEYQSDGGLMIIPGGMKYKGIGIPPDDLQLLQSRQWQVPELCRFFGVPAVMVDGSVTASAAFPASFEGQVQSFLTHTLKPYLDEWEDVIPDSLTLGNEKRDVTAEHNVEGLLRADSAGRAAFYSSGLQNGWMSVNEVRRKENLPPDPAGDQLHAQVNMAPLGQLPGEDDAKQI